jgi:hypothetical protein
MDMSDIVPRNQVTKSGVKGVGAVAGGVGLLVLGSIHGILGLVAGGVVAVVGLALSTSKSDRTAGIVTTAAGVVAAAAALIPGLRWLVVLPAVGLIGAGIWSLVKFFRGLKSRT